MAHTPGPWERREFDEAQTVVLGGEPLGLVAIVSVGKYRPHGHANAHLIVAAPDLLEAAEWLLQRAGESDSGEECGWFVPPRDAQEATRRFKAAIAKARGEQP